MVKLFTYSRNSNCPACLSTKNYFRALNVKYEELDILSNKEEYISLSRQKDKIMVPLIQIGKDIIIGFSREKIDKALKDNNILNINIPK